MTKYLLILLVLTSFLTGLAVNFVVSNKRSQVYTANMYANNVCLRVLEDIGYFEFKRLDSYDRCKDAADQLQGEVE